MLRRVVFAGILATGLPSLALAQAGAPPIQGIGTAGNPVGGVVSVQGVSGGTGIPVTANQGTPNAGGANAWPVTQQAGAGGGATHAQSAALAANLTLKSGAGNLYSFEVAADSTLAGAAWWVMIYDATSAPADGAITPAKCYSLPSGATTMTGAFPTPVAFATGITIGVSTNGCYTKAQSTHALIGGDYQ